MRQPFPTDLTDREWVVLEPSLRRQGFGVWRRGRNARMFSVLAR